MAGIELVEQCCRLGVQAEMPAPVRIAHRLQRLDGDIDGQKMPHPGFEHAAQRIQARAGEADVEHHVEPVAAVRIGRGVGLADDIELELTQRRLCFHDQLAQAAETAAAGMQGDRVAVGQEDRAVVDGDRLRAEQAFGRPQAIPSPQPSRMPRRMAWAR